MSEFNLFDELKINEEKAKVYPFKANFKKYKDSLKDEKPSGFSFMNLMLGYKFEWWKNAAFVFFIILIF